MACPSGCINGGAPPRPPPGTAPREYAAAVSAALAAASLPEDADAALQRVYSLMGADGVGSQFANQVSHSTPPPSHRLRLTRSQHFHTGFTDVQKESGVARGEDGMVNIGSSSMQW